jgi:hypothetical protein
MSKFDYISEAQVIRDQLVGEQLSNWKKRIDEAIEDGATGTEILMALRWTMAELLKASPNLSSDVVARVKDYVIEANKLLG